MNNQEDPMRSTVKPVHQWTTPDSGNPRRRKIEKWLFGAMFLWPVVLLACEVPAKGMHSDSAYPVAAYIGSPLFYAAILIAIALCEYPASRRFLKWLAGIILVIAALWSGVTYYVPFLRHGWKWWNGTIKSPIFWLYVALVVLSIIYLAAPQRAWGWLGDRVKQLWKKTRHGRST